MLALCAPLRYAVRYELRRAQMRQVDQNIGAVLQRRATESTAIYVEEKMSGVDSVHSPLALLTKALARANLQKEALICEFGVYSGTTINHIAAHTTHNVYGFDSFEGLPERWRDGFGKGSFEVRRLPKVRKNVRLIKGWFNETLPNFVQQHAGPVSFLHIDCDLYSSTKTVFEVLGDRILPGCVIVFDEYFNYPGWELGEYKAFQEFVSAKGLGYEYLGYNRLHEQVAVLIKAR